MVSHGHLRSTSKRAFQRRLLNSISNESWKYFGFLLLIGCSSRRDQEKINAFSLHDPIRSTFSVLSLSYFSRAQPVPCGKAWPRCGGSGGRSQALKSEQYIRAKLVCTCCNEYIFSGAFGGVFSLSKRHNFINPSSLKRLWLRIYGLCNKLKTYFE